MASVVIAVRFRTGSEMLAAQLDVLRQKAESSGDAATARLARIALNGHDGTGFAGPVAIEEALAALAAKKLITL
jgi:hypothetical protein